MFLLILSARFNQITNRRLKQYEHQTWLARIIWLTSQSLYTIGPFFKKISGLSRQVVSKCRLKIMQIASFAFSVNLSTILHFVQSTLDISNSDMSNSAKLEASFCMKYTFWFLPPTIIWRWILFYKSKFPEVQINLHFG